jgi:hypothetical protein
MFSSFFFFSLYSQAQSEPSYKSIHEGGGGVGGGEEELHTWGALLFFPKLSHPSIILYLVLPKLLEDACACVQHLYRSQIDAFLPYLVG